LKQRLFERDGWSQKDSEGNVVWYANCAFGCGDVLDFRHATMDRYPIPGRRGGRYSIDNTRLACMPCNSDNQINGNALDELKPVEVKQVSVPLIERLEPKQVQRLRKMATPDVEGRFNGHGIRMDLL
jgi:hypothetical protein